MRTLRCEGLQKSFDGVSALADVHLQFPASGILAIIGPNGAGKTTLINVLTGFLRPDLGHCFLGERETTRLAPHRIARMGVARTFQDVRLIQHATVRDNVLLACPNQKGERLVNAILRFGGSDEETRNRDSIERMLKFVGLTGKASEPAGALSYGQQKLLTLACCLATEARILLLDEPVAGVHPEMAERTLELFRGLRKQGKLVVIIEHDIGAVRKVADHLIVMDQGKIIAQGPPNMVLEQSEILEAYLG